MPSLVIVETMSDGSNPTEEQKNWLAGVLGREVWNELRNVPEFQKALNASLGKARQIALQHLASKEAH